MKLTPENVESYELVDAQSFGAGAGESAVRGLVGGAIAGNAGALAGLMTAPQNDIYVVLIKFKDGKKSLIEDDATRGQIQKWQDSFNYKAYNDYITVKLDELGITVDNRKRKF